ncbi:MULTISPECIES: capsular biosynthesis protein [unclassified Helicobacter]|uniref:capsular biosynthesis protein n=1 Tax=unclassified Helicobacter TaxID=2593540 RepID=UPI000CF0A30B|nr:MULTISPECIES: capsular biosynthesis protein [unclassified Helicobacter]
MRILVLCAANPATNPRPSRMIDNLKEKHIVTAMGLNSSPIDDVEVLSYSNYKKRNIFQEIWLYINVLFKRWDRLIFTKNRLEIQTFLKRRDFDLIICHDLVLLPIVLKNKQSAKVLFDAREFYPKQYTNSLRWRILFQKFNDFLCKTYMPQADKVITVGMGIKKAYQNFYQVDSEVFYSLSKFYDLSPSLMQNTQIKMIYHGYANKAREIEKTIEIMDYCQDDFSLDLMLICYDKGYLKKLEKMVLQRQKRGKKIRIIQPVKFEELITFSNQYDIGVYALPKSNFNLELAMPNKFFEYIQSRLALVTIPHKEMEWFINRYQNGIVSSDYTPKSIAQALNSLSRSEIMKMKIRSHTIAKTLSNEQNKQKIANILKEIFTYKIS